jgi:hypothetical protein
LYIRVQRVFAFREEHENCSKIKIAETKIMWIGHAIKVAVAVATAMLAACSHVSHVSSPQENTILADGASFSAGWRHFPLPGKTATIYEFGRKDGREALMAKAGTSASMMRRDVHIAVADLDVVNFSWQVPALIHDADLAERDLDDSPVRIVLAFDGNKDKFSVKNAILSELAQVMTGEPLPYATLMYVWCNKRLPGSVVINPRTDRIRSVVVESGAKNLRQWLDYQRNIRADFEKAFGEAPGNLVSVGLMTDSDNTKSQVVASYGALHFGHLKHNKTSATVQSNALPW